MNKYIISLLLFYCLLPNAWAMDEVHELSDLSVVGTRRPVHTVTDTAVPIDILSGEDISNQGTTDLSNSLRTLIPSYNVQTQPISDAATFVRPANLRGLGPDQSLVLLNGKRRHRAAVISFLGNGISDGAQGADINVIPAIALKRVEVLRDSASAQYGSDAIAGIINFVLKDRPEGGVITTQWGETYAGDGEDHRVSVNIGLPLTDRGFANISGEWRGTQATIRSVQRDDAQKQIKAGNTAIEQPYAQIWGQPDVRDDFKTFVNLGFDFNDDFKLYAFGNYAQRESEGGFFFRNPDGSGARNGVFRNGKYRLYFSDDPDDPANPNCPKTESNTDGTKIVKGGFDTSTTPEGCFTFHELFPGGFRPKFKGKLSDFAATGGFKGTVEKLNYDLSYTYGENQIDFSIRDTINASLGLKTPTQFELGSYVQTEQTINFDLNRPFDIPLLSSPLYTAAGVELRNEQFEIIAGEAASWEAGAWAKEGASVGANGFSGFSDKVAGKWERSNVAGYLDLETDIIEDLTLKAMLRLEAHESFDLNSDFKFASLYQISDYFGVRGSVGTGFRVPTIGQQNVQNIGTEFEGSNLIERATVRTDSPYAQAFGAQALKAEQSFTVSMGLVADVGAISLTVDYFNIKINDRIGKSRNYTAADRTGGFIGINDPFLQNPVSISFLGNGFDTRTQGVDVTAGVDVDMSTLLPFLLGGKSELIFAGNWTDTSVTAYNPNFLDAKRIIQLQEALPNYRFNLTLQHEQGDWNGLARINYYGAYTEIHLNDLDLTFEPGGEATLDLAVSRTLLDSITLTAGADNILNNYPDRNPFAGVAGSEYPESSPMGSSGGFYYFKLAYLF